MFFHLYIYNPTQEIGLQQIYILIRFTTKQHKSCNYKDCNIQQILIRQKKTVIINTFVGGVRYIYQFFFKEMLGTWYGPVVTRFL